MNLSCKSVAQCCSYRNAFLAAFLSLLLAISAGFVSSYTSTALVKMEGNDSSIHLSKQIKSWVASTEEIGVICGCLIAVPLSEKFGRRKGMMITVLPFVVGWILITLANGSVMLISGRLVTGLCSGLSNAIVPIYLIEISSPEIRGFLGSSFHLFHNIGVLLSVIIGWLLSWRLLAICSGTVPILSLLLYFMPESPRWLVAKGYREEAMKVIIFLHGDNADPDKLVSAIEEDLQKQSSHDTLKISDMKKSIFWKPAILSLVLFFYKEACGMINTYYYAVDIFKMADTTFNSNLSAIIVAIVQILAALTCSLIVDKSGRRILLTISSVGMSVNLISLGTYFFLKEQKMTIESNVFNYVPLVTVIGYISAYSIGYGPIPTIIVNELSPLKGRSAIASLALMFNSLLAFVVAKTFIDLQSAVMMSGTYWLYGGVSLTSVVFVWCLLPETKRKPLEVTLE